MDIRYQDTRTFRCPVHLCPNQGGHEGTDYLALIDNGALSNTSLACLQRKTNATC